MHPSSDAYGQSIKTFHEGRRAYEIVERDDGYFDISSGPAAYFREYQDWPLHEKEAIANAKGRVLDIGTGAGRVALHLQELGLDVTAIDNSPLAIGVCKELGVKKAVLLPLEQISRLKEHFDTIVMFCNNFGLFGSKGNARKILHQLHGMTSEKALILASSMDPHDTKDPVHLDYHRRNVGRGRMPGQLHVRVRYSVYKSAWLDYMLVSPDEMSQLLHGTGWRVREIIRSDGSPYISVLDKVATIK